MDTGTIVALGGLMFIAAMLYSSVGHGGASAYLGAMALFGVLPEVMKPTALALNILVALIASVKFYRAGFFSWNIFWPFALGAVPFAFIGGSITLPVAIYRSVVGVVLIYAAYRLFLTTRQDTSKEVTGIPILGAIVIGAGIGFLSGLTGVGGGIFLSPLLLLMGWAKTKTTSAVSAAFILVNSIAGLAGHISSVALVPGAIPGWAVATGVGGWIGAEYGSRKFSGTVLRRLLAAVLVLAGMKLILV